MRCNICPHNCEIDDGGRGRCQTIINRSNRLRIDDNLYGNCSVVAVDQIEKRPFFHFCPGQKFLSVGLYGCNLECEFCANSSVSQNYDVSFDVSTFYAPKDLIALAHNRKVAGIVFSYSEPVVHQPYLRAVGHAATETNLRLALKTNGFMNKPIARDLGTLFDAFNIDIKGSEKQYRKYCQGSLSVVLDTIETLLTMGIWVEITYLVHPEVVHQEKFHKKLAKWIEILNPDVPVHLLYFYRKGHKEYEKEKLLTIRSIMKERLNNVYLSNLFAEKFIKHRHTYCSECGELMISRNKTTEINSLECCGKELKGFDLNILYNKEKEKYYDFTRVV